MLLNISIITAYLITSDDSASRYKEWATYHLIGWLVEMGNCFRHNTCIYILYLRCEDVVLAILYTDLHITTTFASEGLNSLIFHDNIKCIMDNVTIIHFTQKIWVLLSHCYMTLWLHACYMIVVTICLYGFTVII